MCKPGIMEVLTRMASRDVEGLGAPFDASKSLKFLCLWG